MASASVSDEVAVFIDTSLGTHIAISVSPNLKAADFKRKFESMHSNCYPGIGNIKVDGLMVKRKSYHYHLPESMPIKHAFVNSKRTWFLYVVAYPLNKEISSTPQTEVVHSGLSESRMKSASGTVHVSKTMAANKDTQGSSASSYVEERMSESISVSFIINKYFSIYDEVSSTKCNPRVAKYEPKTPPATKDVRASKSSGVGKRLIVAANNLGISTSDKKPVTSLCKYKCGRSSSVSKLSSLPVFELDDR